jgi:hypothetical protein
MCFSEGNCAMSVPVSARMAAALVSCTPGTLYLLRGPGQDQARPAAGQTPFGSGARAVCLLGAEAAGAVADLVRSAAAERLPPYPAGVSAVVLLDEQVTTVREPLRS